MKFFKIGLILMALAIFIFACTQAPTNTSSTNSNRITQNVNGTTVSYDPVPTNSANTNSAANDELASFKKIYTEKCVLCHKETGEGGEANIEGDKFKVPNFKGDKAIKADDKDFTDTISKGDEKMPAFGKKLKPEEIEGLVKYIRKGFQGK